MRKIDTFHPALQVTFVVVLLCSRPVMAEEGDRALGFEPLFQMNGVIFPAISPSGDEIAYYSLGTDSYRLLVKSSQDISGSRQLLAESIPEPLDLAWNPRSDTLALIRSEETSDSTRIDLITTEGRLLSSISLDGFDPQGGLAWFPNGELLIAGDDNSLLVFDVRAKSLVSQIDLRDYGLRPKLTSISMSPKGIVAFSASSDSASNRERIWTLELLTGRSRPVPVTVGPTDRTPEWVGDSVIVFSRESPKTVWKWGSTSFQVRHLWKVKLKRVIEEKLTNGNVVDDSPKWSYKRGIVVYSHLPLSALPSLGEPSPNERPKVQKLSEALNDIFATFVTISENSRVGWLKIESEQ